MKEDFDKKVRKDAQNTTKNDKNNSNSTKLDQNSSQNTTRADKNNANSTKLDQNQQKGDKNRQNSSQNTVKNEKNNIDTTKNDQNSNKNTVKSDKTRHKERVRTSYKLSGGAKAAIITLAITTGVLGAATIGLGVSTWQMSGQSSNYGTSLESIYQKTFYDLYDSVSSAEVNLSKAISASSSV